jgi:hypothetical protein
VSSVAGPPKSLDALGQQSGVELLKRPRFARGHDGRALKQILQIVIAVAVQSANGALFLRSFELRVDLTVKVSTMSSLRLNVQPCLNPAVSETSTNREISLPGINGRLSAKQISSSSVRRHAVC